MNPTEKMWPRVDTPQEVKKQSLSPEQVQEQNKNQIDTKAPKLAKQLSNSNIDLSKYSPNLKKLKEEWKKTWKELLKILHWKENAEITEKSWRSEVLKVLDTEILKTLPEWQDIDSIATILKKPDGSSFESKEEAKDFLREQFLKWKIKELDTPLLDKDGNVLKDKNWNEITNYTKALEENPILWDIEKNNPELSKEILAIYWVEKLNALSPILEKLKKDWKDIPNNLEDLNKLFIEKLALEQAKQLKKEDPDKPLEESVLKDAAKKILEWNTNVLWSLASWWNAELWQNINFEAWNALANSAELSKAIDSLPEWSKARKALEISQKFLWYNEKDPKQRAELKSFLWFDPAKTPWCKGFVNAVMKNAWISLNSAWSLAARSWVMDWRKLKIPQEQPKPGDLVIVERKWTTTSWTPGWHIWIFIWMSAEGKPIMIGWNQWNRVSIKVERRPIISINRVVPEWDQDNKTENKVDA